MSSNRVEVNIVDCPTTRPVLQPPSLPGGVASARDWERRQEARNADAIKKEGLWGPELSGVVDRRTETGVPIGLEVGVRAVNTKVIVHG